MRAATIVDTVTWKSSLFNSLIHTTISIGGRYIIILAVPSLILLATPVLVVAFLGIEVAELLTTLGERGEKVKAKANEEENGLFVR